jgi:hypothetical protein
LHPTSPVSLIARRRCTVFAHRRLHAALVAPDGALGRAKRRRYNAVCKVVAGC